MDRSSVDNLQIEELPRMRQAGQYPHGHIFAVFSAALARDKGRPQDIQYLVYGQRTVHRSRQHPHSPNRVMQSEVVVNFLQ